MSQRRQKKQLSIMDNVNSLTDQELRAALKRYDVTVGPITDSTRNLYRKKLASTIEENEADLTPVSSQESVKSSPRGKGTTATPKTTSALAAPLLEEEDEEDTSDEEFYVRDEDLEEEEDDDEEFEDEEEEDVLSELQDDDVTSSRINATGIGDLTTRSISEPGAFASRISIGILISSISFFVVILSYYLFSMNELDLTQPLKQFRIILLMLLVFSPTCFIGYMVYRYFRSKSLKDSQRVCKLVSEAIELLQSPDNPKGLMPILHIRDTLLTPAERKSKQMTALWNKALKFVEEHESRVKVEIVNIDGEDFRAWKWIGTRKL